jgi:hypothetical protein
MIFPLTPKAARIRLLAALISSGAILAEELAS